MEQKPLPRKYQSVKRVLRVKRSSAGLGLFTEAEIEKGGFVVEYAGPIRGAAEIRGMKCKYLFETNAHRFVDGSPRWNLARYINHSCAPNCKIEILRGRIYVFARRWIRPGEELAYNYGKAYFEEYIAPNGCRCCKCIRTVPHPDK
jgi:uncharacterized protein